MITTPRNEHIMSAKKWFTILPGKSSSPEKGQDQMAKRHQIIIESWFDASAPREERAPPGFRWTAIYEKNDGFRAQGFEDTHKSAREAAEAYLKEHGVDLDWVTLNAK